MNPSCATVHMPAVEIDVIEPGRRSRKGRIAFDLGRDVKFSTAGLESYAFASWQPVIHDAMVVAAVVEYGDRVVKRPPRGWARQINVRVPVHDPRRWSGAPVLNALQDAVGFLTGDYWNIEFLQRSCDVSGPSQGPLSLPVNTQAVLAFSDGIDSRAVAGILGQSLGEKLVRVRVGGKSWDLPFHNNKHLPFTNVPYDVSCNMPNREGSSRSRGFKFALISGIAAYLAEASEIVIPESGQGALGPVLVGVGHTYPDYRNHPFFARRMERFLNALFGTELTFVFPRVWNTKGETLSEYIGLTGGGDWEHTRSCWRNNRWCSVNGRLRQCGVCAACLLRRVSVHAADQTEAADAYVATNVTAPSLDEAVDRDFTRQTRAFREYAIAGVLHMDHLAEMADPTFGPFVRRHATLLAPHMGLSVAYCEDRIRGMLQKHAEEWRHYLATLGENSFIQQWAQAGQ